MSRGAIHPPTTVGVLYPGELGAALSGVLAARGARVVTTLRHRSTNTLRRCTAAGVMVLDSMADVARQADVVISVVCPGAAEEVARDYLSVAHLAPLNALFTDANSVRPELIEALAAELETCGRGFVDAAVNGLAENLTGTATLFLSGARAKEVAHLFGDTVAVRVLGGRAGRASTMKMLLSGVSKGTCALFLELAVLAERHGMLDETLEAAARIYPEIAALAARMLPTYPRHAGRRSHEMRQLEATARSSGMEPCVIQAVARVHDALARGALDAPGTIENGRGAVPSLVRHFANRAGESRSDAVATAGANPAGLQRWRESNQARQGHHEQ